jgi:hypothetical protein
LVDAPGSLSRGQHGTSLGIDELLAIREDDRDHSSSASCGPSSSKTILISAEVSK